MATKHAFRIDRSIYTAIPETSSLFIEAKGKQGSNIDLFPIHDINAIDSILLKDHSLSANQDHFLILAHTINHNQSDWVYVFSKKESFFEKIWNGLKARYFKDVMSNPNYLGFPIKSLNLSQANMNFIEVDDLIVLCESNYLIEVMVDHILAHKDIRYTDSFKDVYKTSKKSKESVLFINHENIALVFNGLFSDYGYSLASMLLKPKGWTALDYIKEKEFQSLNGYVFNSSYDTDQTLDIFDCLTENVEFTLYESFPSDLSFFYWMGIGSLDSILSSFQWLNINDYVENELAIVKVGGNNEKNYLCLKVDPLLFKESLLFQQSIFIDSINTMSNSIYKLDSNCAEILSLILKNVSGFEQFSSSKNSYYTIFKNQLIFSDDKADLKHYLQQLYEGNLLSRNLDYIKFIDNYKSSRPTFLGFVNIKRCAQMFDKMFIDSIQEEELVVSQSDMALFEMNRIKNKPYLNLVFNSINKSDINKEASNKVEIIWDHSIISRPTFMRNHKNGSFEILFQDSKFNLCLTSLSGELLWMAKLKEGIKSDIKQIDYLGNKKLQYVFNTDNYIYLVDRAGNLVPGFPIKLKEKAINEVFVVDYDNDNNYRFFIAGEMGVYGYSKKGILLKEWSPSVIASKVSKPLKHMSVSNKDYLIITDSDGNLILKNRRGENRIKPVRLNTTFINDFKADFASMPYALVNADTSFNIVKVYLDGKQESHRIKPINYFDFTFFDYVDIDGDNKRDYLFMNKNQINGINRDNEFLITYSFPEEMQSNCYKIIHKSDLKYLGVLSEKTERLYLINNSGELENGFPVDGRKYIDYCYYDNQLYLSTLGGEQKIFIYNVDVI
mgnify:CR=1 FL=1